MINGHNGFTILELLLVIAILFIIVGIVSPRLDFMFKNQRLEEDSKKLASNINLAQQYAVGQKEEHRYYGIVFYSGGYRIVPYNDPDTPLAPIVVSTSVNLDGDIPFSSGVNISGAQNIIFDFRGGTLLPNDIQIVLSVDSTTKTVKVNHLTGHVTVD